jgi:hypothetical protein
MAIYHLSIKRIARSSGRSSVAAAAYRARTRLLDERTGLLHDYQSYRGGALLAEACLAPDGQAVDREDLWNTVEKKNNKPGATPAWEIEVALPAELSPEDQTALATGYARELAARYGVAVDATVHAPDPEGDNRNIHAHLLLSYCEISMGPDGEIIPGKKKRDLDPICIQRDGGLFLADTERPRWAELCNQALERSGALERVDHRSLAAQGIDRVAGVHLGPAAAAMGRKGVETDRGVMARESLEIEGIEGLIGQIEQELAKLAKEVDLTPFAASRRGSRTLDVGAAGTKPFTNEKYPSKKGVFAMSIPEEILGAALGDPSERSRRCQAYRIPGKNLSFVEALKGARLEAAMVTMGEGITVVLKADRALGREARERLTMEVQRVVPGAQEMDLPEHGMVLEAKGVVFSRCREIAGEAERARDRDGGLEL